jgi:metal-dependent HD superfamily phosphatase/phosphodiesterase
MSNRAKFVKEIEIEDPDTGAPVQLEVYKHENGGMFAIDASFIDQVADETELMESIIMDPFSHGDPQTLYLEEE